MAEMVQGVVGSLLGRLTSVLLEEAQLLSSVHGDVEFIKDEMASMNGLLRYLTEAQYRDRQVRTWMKQLVGLARDCEGNVELYIRLVVGTPGDPRAAKGLPGCLRRVLRLLRTAPARHRIATRIRELKVRAQDVSDRRQRYGVTLPASAAAGADAPGAGDEEDLPMLAVLDGEPPEDWDTLSNDIETLVKWLSEEAPAVAGDGSEPQLRVIPIVGSDWLGDRVAQGVYQHSSVATSFHCKAWVNVGYQCDVRNILCRILDQVTHLQPGQEDEYIEERVTWWHDEDEEQLARILREYLRGRRFLIVLEHVYAEEMRWGRLRSALLHADSCPPSPGSAIILTTDSDRVARSSSPYKIAMAETPAKFFLSRAEKLGTTRTREQNKLLMQIFNELYPDAFAMKTFLHLLYANPNRTDHELEKYRDIIYECKLLNKRRAKQVLMFCYNELPSKYRSCLFYLTIFPRGHIFRATSLARRWIAEGLITTTASAATSDNIASPKDRSKIRASAVVEAQRYLDALVMRGFVHPAEISAAGNIKRCTVHHEVHELITRIARDVNFIDNTNLTPELAQHFSIHNRIGQQASHSYGDGNDIAAFLPSLAASSQWQLLKVLDLEGCRDLKKHNLKSICKILLLKYLSLRNTEVTELPKDIKELQCLETLDIRETKLRVLAKKAIVLPQLKHFLAGHKISASNDARGSEESFSAVRIPYGIQRMKNMEILSHIKVINSDSELAGITQLLKLRKLGVTLHGENAKLNDLFQQIEKLHSCLRSLSLRIDHPAGPENHDAGMVVALCTPPRFLENLNINGLTSGLPHMFQELHQLAKLTLTETYLKENALRILGKLHGLCYLRLQRKSYVESELAFKEGEFQSLMFLLVEGNNISGISFVIGAAPKLERIVWSFSTMEALCGLDHLSKLKKLELNGNCNLDQVRATIEAHRNNPVLKHNPHRQHQENGIAVAASTSSQ